MTLKIRPNAIEQEAGPFTFPGGTFNGLVTINTGAAAVKGLIVKGAVTQTANLQEWQDSTGAVLNRIEKDGDITIKDGQGIQWSGWDSKLYGNLGTVRVTQNCNMNGTYNVGYRITGTQATGGIVTYAHDLLMYKTVSDANSFTCLRMQTILSADVGTQNVARGMLNQIRLTGNSDLSWGFALHGRIDNEGTGTIGDARGCFVDGNINTGGGTITNNYGLYVGAQTVGSSGNYAIYTNAGVVRFGDYVTIDQASPTGAQPVLFLDQGDVSEQCIQFSSDAADRDIHLFTVNVTGTPAMDWLETADVFAINKALRGTISHWWASQHFAVTSLSPGASGATFVAPDANTSGGYNLDDDAEYLYFEGHAHSDWDAGSDMEIEIMFEVDVDNTGGNVGDVAVFDIEVYLKGSTETATKTQSLTDSVTIDQSARYKQFEATMTIDYDSGTDPIDAGDTIALRLNFDRTNSDITDVIVNHITLKYKTAKVNEEV